LGLAALGFQRPHRPAEVVSVALGEAVAAGATIEEAIRVVLAEAAGHGEVSGAAVAEVGSAGIQATESREVVHGSRCGLEERAWI
jgi:hypothetical protein